MYYRQFAIGVEWTTKCSHLVRKEGILERWSEEEARLGWALKDE